MTQTELDFLLERFDLTDRAGQRSIVGALVERLAQAQDTCRDLIAVCQYAAGSFAQVPSDHTVPPIVLHDCKDKLDAAWRLAAEKMG